MALTNDIHTLRDGSNVHEPLVAPVKASEQLYSGAIAVLDASGRLHSAASASAGDTCAGIIGEPAGGTYVKTGPGIKGGTNDTAVYAEVLQGNFFLNGGTGADALTEANVGATVYVIDEVTVGATSGGNSRPAAGTMRPITPSTPSGKVSVRLGNPVDRMT
jgi:hypothetical protein